MVLREKSESGELLIVVTNAEVKNAEVKNAVSIYLRRREIENLFKALKSGGFNFEDTRMTKLERVDKHMAVVSIAFCWAHKIGVNGEQILNRLGLSFIVITADIKNLLIFVMVLIGFEK